MNEGHLTEEQIALLVDGRLEEEIAAYARIHLVACETCRRSHQSAKRFDMVARSLPLERTRPELTERVMAALPRRKYNPVSLRILGLIAPALGALLVLATISVVWIWYGGTGPSGDSDSRRLSAFSEGFDKAGRTVGEFLTLGVKGMTRVAPFLTDWSTFTVSMFSLAAVLLLATVDRFVLRKLEG
jgi:hypothetical protein